MGRETTETTVKAVAIIRSIGERANKDHSSSSSSSYNLSGTLHFIHNININNRKGKGSSSLIIGKISGLRPGCLHALHIHSFGDTTLGCSSTGPHFNPHNQDHGSPIDLHRHAGDLGNILAGPDGVADVAITDTQISLSGQHSVLGRAVVVHANPDDLGKGGHELSKTTGNAGARIGCGVIGLQSVVYGAARI